MAGEIYNYSYVYRKVKLIVSSSLRGPNAMFEKEAMQKNRVRAFGWISQNYVSRSANDN